MFSEGSNIRIENEGYDLWNNLLAISNNILEPSMPSLISTTLMIISIASILKRKLLKLWNKSFTFMPLSVSTLVSNYYSILNTPTRQDRKGDKSVVKVLFLDCGGKSMKTIQTTCWTHRKRDTSRPSDPYQMPSTTSTYDINPLGLLGHMILKGKLVLKGIWRRNTFWDKSIHEEKYWRYSEGNLGSRIC